MKKTKKLKYGIDLGSANIKICSNFEGIFFNEPSILIFDNKKNKVVAIGLKAKSLIGKLNDSYTVVHLIKNGAITNINFLGLYISNVLNNNSNKFSNASFYLSCFVELSPLEKEYIKKSLDFLNYSSIEIIEEPLLSLIGMGGNINSNNAVLSINFGAESVTIAAVVDNNIIAYKTTKKAGSQFDKEIIKIVKYEYGLLIGETTAESIKKNILSLLKENKSIKVFGYGINNGMPTDVVINGNSFNKLISIFFEEYIELIASLLEILPSEAVKDICNTGFVVSGGFSQLRGIDIYLNSIFNIPVTISNISPLATINGLLNIIKS